VEEVLEAFYKLCEILQLEKSMGQEGQSLLWEDWSMGSAGLCLSAEGNGHSGSLAKARCQPIAGARAGAEGYREEKL